MTSIRAGTVRSVRRDTLEVELDAASACARCAEGRGCGIGAVLSAGPPVRLDVPSPMPSIEPGARVRVAVDAPEADWLLAPALGFGLPSAGLLGGTLVAGAVGGAAGLAGGLVAWRACAVRLEAWFARRPDRIRARIVGGASEAVDASDPSEAAHPRRPSRPSPSEA